MGKVDSAVEKCLADREGALRRGNMEKASDYCLLLGQMHKINRDWKDAMDAYQYGLQLARDCKCKQECKCKQNQMRALRAIVLMKIEKGDKKCLELLKDYEKLAKDDPTEYQLMLSTSAFCHVRLYTRDYMDVQLLYAGYESADKALKILLNKTMNKDLMDKDAGDILVCRHVDSNRRMAEIFGLLGDENEAEYYLEEAFEWAGTAKGRIYEIIRTRLDFVSVGHQVKLRQALCDLTEPGLRAKKVDARIFLADAHFDRREIDCAIGALFEVAAEALKEKKTATPDEDKKKYSDLLVFAYIVETRLEQLHECTKRDDTAGQKRLHKKLADLHRDAGYNNAALHHYKELLERAETQEEKRAALSACAETSKDLKLFGEAEGYYDSLRDLLKEMNEDVYDTLVSLNQLLLLNSIIDEDLGKEISKLEEERRNKAENDDEEEEELEKEGEDEEEKDELDEMRRDEILRTMQVRAEEVANKKKLLDTAGKKNFYGETKLIEKVRNGTFKEVREIVEEGKKGLINQGDGNGWTPLSEAVHSGNFEMVKYLVEKGANSNSCSRGGWCDYDFGGKITPLMEACFYGRHEIADWLLDLEQGADLVKATNLDGWSAADFMTEYLETARSNGESKANLAACKAVIDKIKDMQRRNRSTPREGKPPRPKRKSKSTDWWRDQKKLMKMRKQERKRLTKKGHHTVVSDAIAPVRNPATARRHLNYESPLRVRDNKSPVARPRSSRRKRKRAELCSDSDEEKGDDEVENRPRDEENAGRKRQRGSMENDYEPGVANADDIDSDEDMPRRKSTGSRVLRRIDSEEDVAGTAHPENADEANADEEMVNGDEQEGGEDEDDSDADLSDFIDDRSEYSQYSDSLPNDDPENDDEIDNADETNEEQSQMKMKKKKKNRKRRAIVSEEEEEEDEHEENEDSEDSGSNHKVPRKRRRRTVAADDDTGVIVVDNEDESDEDSTKSESDEDDDVNGSGESSDDDGDEPNNGNGSAGSSSSRPVAPEQSKTQEKEPEQSSESSVTPADNAIAQLEAESCSLNVRGGGSMYTEENLTKLWKEIKDYVQKKKSEDPDWRVQNIRIANIDLPCSTLLAIIQMRPRNELSLRHCEIDNEKLQDMLEELEIWSDGLDCQLNSLGLSFNRLSGSSDLLARLATAFRGLHTLSLQGLSGIEKGTELMKTLRELPLKSLNLSENPWVDDDFMRELLKEGEDGQARLSTLKILQISKCAIRNMVWLEAAHGLASLKTLSLAENCAVTEAGWRRVVGFIQSTATTLTSLDVRGTSIRAMMLEPLATRPSTTPLLTVSVSRCNGITPAEISRVLGPLVVNGQPLKMKLQLEQKKVEEVIRTAPAVAEKALKVASEAFN